jgi:hypothetical protein
MRTARTLVAERLQARFIGVRTLRLYARARRHRTQLLAAAVGLGILLMMIHWG